MKSESQVKKEIKDYLNSLGLDCWYFMPVPMGYGRKGIPDFIVCLRGTFYAIEAKAEGKINNTTPWQDAEIDRIHVAHGVSFVADSVEKVRDILRAV